MEEIKGTAGIEKEILEDAKRRVEKLLANARAEAGKVAAAAQADAEAKIEALKVEFEKKLSTYKQESLDRLPLERVRLRTKYLDVALKSSFAAWVSNIDGAVFGDFCLRRFEAVRGMIPACAVKVRHRDVDASFLDTVVNSLRKDREVELVEAGSPFDRGLYLEPADSSMIIRITSEELAHAILDKYRGELVTALFPDGIADGAEGEGQ